jgi:arabinan endo-1,5-alpha-L-arabinosidase
MNRCLLLGSMLLLLLAACQQTSQEPTVSSSQAAETPAPAAVMLEPTGQIQQIHDPVIAREGDAYYVFSTGKRIPVICSQDKTTWEHCGRVFERNPAWTREINPNLTDIWAPDISFFNNRWHLYYAVSTFGTQNSAIGLATNVTLDPESPDFSWVDQGLILRSQPGDPWNAIDANLVLDEHGEPWLAWGSFWSGIWLGKIDPATGQLTSDPYHHLADRSAKPDSTTAVEAPFIVQRNGQWYLFVSFDQCCQGVNSTYHVRVGRSDSLTGPYVDRDGAPLTEGGGSLILSEYGQWKGPGHNGLLVEDGVYWMVYHAYDAKQIGVPKLRIESIAWGADGWPSLPSQTAGP